MADRLRVACVQINSSRSKAENLERMEPLLVARGRDGADLVLLPEKWNGLGSHEILLDVAEPLEGGETVEAMSGWARTHGITLVGGSIAERRDGREKLERLSSSIPRARSQRSTGRSTCSTSRSAGSSTESPTARSRATGR